MSNRQELQLPDSYPSLSVVSMRISRICTKPGDIQFGIIYGAIAILALVAARVLPVQDILPPCLIRSVAGIPCPTCGMTRSLVHLAHGDIAGSLVLNPLFSLVMMAVLLLFFASSARLPFHRSRIAFTLSRREGTLLRTGMAVIFLANWIYLVFNL